MIFIETLVYIVRDNKVLLIRKKRGLGAGLYNGVGGKVEEGEGIIDAAIRECEEEIGIKPTNLRWSGLLEFWNYEDDKVESVHFVYVFITDSFDGKPIETEEAEPLWFDIDKIPYHEMWEDDKLWLPRVLEGKNIYGHFDFIRWKLTRSEVYELKPTK